MRGFALFRTAAAQLAGMVLCAGFLGVVAAGGPSARAEEAPPQVSAQSAVVITADTGLVLYEENAHEQRSMASTTKILTALLALEEVQRADDPVVSVTAEMTEVEGSSMGLLPGDELRLSGLAAGMLLVSGNDAANAAALFLDGSFEGFAQRMNERAKKIGMAESSFVTPSGLDAEGHYSTAYDMALLAREALKNSSFRALASSTDSVVEFLAPEKRVTLSNHNKLLQAYEGCIGVKTGYTQRSGRCLVSAAQRDGVTLIAVTLDDPDDWADHEALLDYGFSQVTRVSLDGEGLALSLPVAGGEPLRVSLQAGAGAGATLPVEQADRVETVVYLPRFCYAPVRAGQVLGKIELRLEGSALYSVPLCAAEDVSAPAPREPESIWDRIGVLWRKRADCKSYWPRPGWPPAERRRN